MELKLDTVSCRALCLSETEVERWVLVVLSGQRVRELIVWGKGCSSLIGSEDPPRESLVGTGWEGDRLKLYFKSRKLVWDLGGAQASTAKYRGPADARGARAVKLKPGVPVFRSRGRAVVTFIDADTRMTLPLEIFRLQRQRFDALPASVRFMACFGPFIEQFAWAGSRVGKLVFLLLLVLGPIAGVIYLLTLLRPGI